MKLLILLVTFLLPTFQYGQNVNMVIQVNEALINGGISDIYLHVTTANDERNVPVDYLPGDLIINEKAWKIINNDTSAKLSLHLDYNSFVKNRHEIAHFYVDLSRQHLKQPYLILNIYDFKSKKYRRRYQSHTKKNFLAELIFSGSGAYIRNK